MYTHKQHVHTWTHMYTHKQHVHTCTHMNTHKHCRTVFPSTRACTYSLTHALLHKHAYTECHCTWRIAAHEQRTEVQRSCCKLRKECTTTRCTWASLLKATAPWHLHTRLKFQLYICTGWGSLAPVTPGTRSRMCSCTNFWKSSSNC